MMADWSLMFPGVQKQPRMLEKDVSMLRRCSVASIRIHHELGIGQMLFQEEGVDRNNNDVLISMYDEGRLRNLAQHRIAIA